MFITVTNGTYTDNYNLFITFNTGEKGLVNLENDLYGEIFEPLRNKIVFKKFSIPLNTIEWENGADLAPEYLYFKAFQNVKKLQKQFKKWGYV